MEVVISPTTEAAIKQYAASNGQDAARFAGTLLEDAARTLALPNGDTDKADEGALDRAITQWTRRTPEQLEAARARALAVQPAQALPPGKTLEDVFFGQWPGHESDEEIARALKHLS